MLNNINNVKSTNYNTIVKPREDKKIQKEHKATNEKKSEEKSIKDIDSMLNQADIQTKNFEKLISSIFNEQSNKQNLVYLPYENNLKGFLKNLVVDKETILKAKEDIAEDGYYGVKKTSDRIFSFASSLIGDDLGKLEKMRNAVDKGFDNVREMWGDELPDISKDTYDSVMQKFDDLEKNILSNI